jgi:hypothetical protein
MSPASLNHKSFTSFTDFRCHGPKVSWTCHTRPEVCYFANTSAQVTEHAFSPANVKSFHAVLENLRKTADRKLRFQNLDINALRIVAYSDASFANNADHSSQLGFVIFFPMLLKSAMSSITVATRAVALLARYSVVKYSHLQVRLTVSINLAQASRKCLVAKYQYPF